MTMTAPFPFPICRVQRHQTSLTFTLCRFITVTLMALTGDAADARSPESGERAHFGESGPGPVIWVTTSQLLGLGARPQLAPL